MKTREKIIFATLLFLFFINQASALQDANITMKNTKGLCFYLEDVNCQLCDNISFSLDGTSDHIISLTSERPYGNCNQTITNETSENLITSYIADGDMVVEYVLFGIMFSVFISWIFATEYKNKNKGGYRRK